MSERVLNETEYGQRMNEMRAFHGWDDWRIALAAHDAALRALIGELAGALERTTDCLAHPRSVDEVDRAIADARLALARVQEASIGRTE